MMAEWTNKGVVKTLRKKGEEELETQKERINYFSCLL
jgi:hypothetical protein